jgi:hypothetical protein
VRGFIFVDKTFCRRAVDGFDSNFICAFSRYAVTSGYCGIKFFDIRFHERLSRPVFRGRFL